MEISDIFFLPSVFILGICFGAMALWLTRPVWHGFRLRLRAVRARRRAGLLPNRSDSAPGHRAA